MKVSLRIEEITGLFKNEIPNDTSIYIVVKHDPENYIAQTEKVKVSSNTIEIEDNNEFEFNVESSIEPVVINVLNSNDDELASYALGLTDFTDGVAAEKTFSLLPEEGYSENAKIKLRVLVESSKPKNEPSNTQNEPVQKEQGTVLRVEDVEDDDDIDEEEESLEEIKAGRTKEERNRDKARLLGQNYDEIYAAARDVAEERYRIVLEKNAQLLLENEEWINESGGNGQNEEKAQNDSKKVESSDSD